MIMPNIIYLFSNKEDVYKKNKTKVKIQTKKSYNKSVNGPIRTRPFDSEGWGLALCHFLEMNILTLKMLEINNLSSSGKKII